MLPRRTLPTALEVVACDYEAALGVPIVLHYPPRGYSRHSLDRRLHVHLHALPFRPLWLALSSTTSTVPLPVVLGHRLAGTDAYAPPGRLARGVNLTDEDGRAVLHVLFNNIYVLFDLIGQPEPLPRLLLRKSLDLVLPHVTPWISEVAARPAPRLTAVLNRLRRETGREEGVLREAARARAREAYAEQHRRGLREDSRFVEEEIRAAEHAVEELSRRLTQEARHLAACRRRLRVLRGETADAAEVADDWRRLEGLEGVRDVVVYGGGIRLVTGPIEVAHGGARYRLGSFEIDLAETGGIAVRNLTDAYGLYDHPHVWNGRPCLGNVREGVAKLVAEYQWVAAAEVLLDFLRTVTPQDWYVPVTHWKATPA
jgi:hypothetical protein